jgi:ABC-type lipoprotein release transport system permease subunit
MTYGGSIALIVIGAILRFAISYSPSGIDLQLVGVILMIAGVLGLIISLVWMFGRRRRTVTTTSAAVPRTEVYEERRYTEPPL